jgi:hypothetical protein
MDEYMVHSGDAPAWLQIGANCAANVDRPKWSDDFPELRDAAWRPCTYENLGKPTDSDCVVSAAAVQQ